MNILGHLWERTTGFDYVDRVLVWAFMAVNLMVAIFALDAHLTAVESAEIAPALEMLGYLLLFFLIWPLIRLAAEKLAKRLTDRYESWRQAA